MLHFCRISPHVTSAFRFFEDPNADTQWNDQLRRFNIIEPKEEIKTEEERFEISRGKDKPKSRHINLFNMFVFQRNS